MIRCQYKNDLEEYKRFCVFHLFVARGAQSFAYPILFFGIGIVLCVFGGLSGNSILFVGAGALFAVAVIMPFAMQALQKSKAEKRVRANANFLKTQQFFCFDENSVTLKLKAGDREEEYESPYEQIAGIYERKDLFYVYIGKTQALIVPKENLEGGSADDLAQLFRKTGKRFKEKKSLRKKTAV